MRLHRKDTPHYKRDIRLNDTNKPDAIIKLLKKDETRKIEQNGGSKPTEMFLDQLEVVLEKEQGVGMGLSIAGGSGSKPFVVDDPSIFISRVTKDGAAAQVGLRVGDKLLAVDDVIMEGAMHSFAVEVLKRSGDVVKLMVERWSRREVEEDEEEHNNEDGNSVGESVSSSVTSSTNEVIPLPQTDEKPPSDVFSSPEPTSDTRGKILTCNLAKSEDQDLGFSVAGGKGFPLNKDPDANEGIFVSRVVEGGMADVRAGLQVKDQILSINGVDMTSSVSHEEAATLLRHIEGEIVIVVRRHNPIIEQEEEESPIKKSEILQHSQSVPNQPSSSPSSRESPVKTSLESPPVAAKRTSIISQSGASIISAVANCNNSNSVSRGSSFQGGSLLLENPRLVSPSGCGMLEEVILDRTVGQLGMSIVGGVDHDCHPFGANEPGIIVSKIQPVGAAHQSNLRVGDRILTVDNVDLRGATHDVAVAALLSGNNKNMVMLVRHDPPPPDMKEVRIVREPGEKLGLSIRGGSGGFPGNPDNPKDMGIFISNLKPEGAAFKCGKLQMGDRILEVDNKSLLGCTHREAVQILRGVGSDVTFVVCWGFDAREPPLPKKPRHQAPAEENDVSVTSQQDVVTSQQPDENDVVNNDVASNQQELDEKLAKAEKEVSNIQVEKQPDAEDNATNEVEEPQDVAAEKEQTPSPEPSSPARDEEKTPEKKFVKKEIFSPFEDDVKPLTYKQLSATPSRTSQKNSLSEMPTTPTSPSATQQPTSAANQEAPIQIQRMSFKERQKYFEQEIQQQNLHKRETSQRKGSSRSSDAASVVSNGSSGAGVVVSGNSLNRKKVSLVSDQDLHSMRQEEAKKLNTISRDQLRKSVINDEEDNEDNSSQVSSRLQSTTSADNIERALSPSERRAVEAEKRKQYRQAKFKSLEAEALQAQMVITKEKMMQQRNSQSSDVTLPSNNP